MAIALLSPDGELVWRHETGDQVDSGPVLAPDGTLYIGSDDHRLYAFAR
ncbi:MAG: PQQ-binding-like beta-propeller repeat protein [Polyangia bacterium]